MFGLAQPKDAGLPYRPSGNRGRSLSAATRTAPAPLLKSEKTVENSTIALRFGDPALLPTGATLTQSGVFRCRWRIAQTNPKSRIAQGNRPALPWPEFQHDLAISDRAISQCLLPCPLWVGRFPAQPPILGAGGVSDRAMTRRRAQCTQSGATRVQHQHQPKRNARCYLHDFIP